MYNRSMVCKIANTLTVSMSRADAFRKAWELVKAQIKVQGVMYSKRQTAIAHLERYSRADIAISLRREQGNVYDFNAIAVIAEVSGRGAYNMGYMPAEVAATIAPVLDRGINVGTVLKAIVGGYMGLSYGLRIGLAA